MAEPETPTFAGKIDRATEGGVLISAAHAAWMASCFRLAAERHPPPFSNVEVMALRMWAHRFEECLRLPPELLGSDYG